MSAQKRRQRGRGIITPSMVAVGLTICVASEQPANAVIVYDTPNQNITPPPGGQGYEYVGRVGSGGTLSAAEKSRLKNVLTEDEMSIVTENGGKNIPVKIKFRLLELF